MADLEKTKDLAWAEQLPQEFTPSQIANIKANMPSSMANVNINNMEFYDDSERKVAWRIETIDGVKKRKPIYQKTVITSNVSSGNTTISIASNIDKIFFCDIYGVDNNGNTSPIPNGDNNNAYNSVYYFNTSGGIVLTVGSSFSYVYCTSVVKYSKSTDSWEVAE